jgi:hypothetical protein
VTRREALIVLLDLAVGCDPEQIDSAVASMERSPQQFALTKRYALEEVCRFLRLYDDPEPMRRYLAACDALREETANPAQNDMFGGVA